VKIIDVKKNVLLDMAKAIGIGPEQLQCQFCKVIVGGRLPNGTENSYIFGTTKNHIRIIHGIHGDVAFYTREGIICVCSECAEKIRKEIPEILSAKDPSEPIKGGHFITTFEITDEGKQNLISRFQGDLTKFKKVMEVLA